MSIDLKRVQVTGLFDAFKLDVPIEDNTLILVGENGSGKSTLINLIYYAITAQWDRLSELPFQLCTITIGNKDYYLDKKRLPVSRKDSSSALRFFQRTLPKEVLNNLLEILADKSPEYWSTSLGREKLRDISKTFSVGSKTLPFNAFLDLVESNPLYVRNNQTESDQDSGTKALEELINSNKTQQVLFLPTYRRIEKELSVVFPDLNLEDTNLPYQKNRRIRREATHIELVEFGMTDVDTVFKSALTTLDQRFRSELNKFTGSYLHTILQGLYKNVDPSLLATEEVAETVDLMLSRIGEDILPEDDRIKLRSLLADVGASQDLTEDQSISAHFLTSLVKLHQKQREYEIPVHKMVDFINKYLSNKKLKFNPTAFELVIQRNDTDKDCEVPLYGLSSGEKQIVSLFSHVFLSGYEDYFVVIDEPELSISVPWQRRFLQDLKDTEKCSGLIAVTHSPFVFENSLSKYAHSISEFMTES